LRERERESRLGLLKLLHAGNLTTFLPGIEFCDCLATYFLSLELEVTLGSDGASLTKKKKIYLSVVRVRDCGVERYKIIKYLKKILVLLYDEKTFEIMLIYLVEVFKARFHVQLQVDLHPCRKLHHYYI